MPWVNVMQTDRQPGVNACDEGATRVSLRHGPLIGRRVAGCCVWLGIPYAMPPTGALRWRAPVAAAPWEGVLAATTLGASCPQLTGRWVRAKSPAFDEDCLHLNVWSPAADTKRRPVLVWIHGGGFTAGSAAPYDGAHLAVMGDIVVVTLNYRLGVFGFVNFGAVTGPGDVDGNLGLRDQIMALEWVRDNIEAFGGDPDCVTVAGHSAGSVSVSLLMLCEQARPLFHRVILQSGVSNLIHEADISVKVAELYAAALGVGDMGAQRLRELDVVTLLKAQRSVDKQLPGMLPASPWFDGQLLPAGFAAADALPPPDIPMLAGTTRDEIRLFELRPGPALLPMLRAQFSELMHRQLGKHRAEDILAHYPESRAGTRRLGTDAVFCVPTIQLAQRNHPAWLYRFDAGHPWFGAIHGMDYLYVWHMTGVLAFLMRGGPLLGRRAALAQRMQQCWVGFVRDGAPDHDWPRFEAPHYPTRIFGLKDRLEDNPEAVRLNAWQGQVIVPAGIAANDKNKK